MRLLHLFNSIAVVTLCQACTVSLAQSISPSELDATERSSFTADGRLFVIGLRPDGRADAGPWLVEIVKTDDGGHTAENLVAGTMGGTSDGTLTGTPVGESCAFSGMKAQGMRIYAACVVPSDLRAALFEVDLAAGTVRTGEFTSCNAEPSASPCEPTAIYPNGMAIDAEGRIYVSNMTTHIVLQGDMPSVSLEGSGTIIQISIDKPASESTQLDFTHRSWFSADIITDGVGPNGVQIEGSVLYYAAGPNINRVDIAPDGRAGAASVHYVGPTVSYIDDFAVSDGRMVLARTIPPAVVALDRAAPFGTAPELGTQDMGINAVPSSISYQSDVPAGDSVFPAGSVIVTCWMGGGLYSLSVQE